jgi:predicted phosphodiesterase
MTGASNSLLQGRVAALYDVHGNLPALEAALADVDAEGVDLLLSGGDLLLGPQPAECLELLRRRGAIFIRGNCDRAVAGAPDREDPWLDRVEWTAGRLSAEQLEFVRRWPETVSLEVDGMGPVLFCHGSPRSDEEVITAITPPKRLDPMLDGVLERTIVGGHTHVQFDRLIGDRRLVNAGSVGLPYEGEAGIACWALLGPDVELRRARYDVQRAVEALDESGYPDGDAAVRGFLLEPSSADEATTHFERLATEDPAAS